MHNFDLGDYMQTEKRLAAVLPDFNVVACLAFGFQAVPDHIDGDFLGFRFGSLAAAALFTVVERSMARPERRHQVLGLRHYRPHPRQ